MTFIRFKADEREEYLSTKKATIFEHLLVPEHVLLKQEDVERVLKKFRIKPYQLPKIRASDPAARAIDAAPGDLIKVIRKSPTAGEAVSYRYVVEG